ncbi:DNA polymerase III subunit beta [bacterium BMS3Abin07]|nr:DNA polymerase III subunit beta [bacterium BMS3Abin07]GBE32330.1 DNA polymerase III subunit beta [bacterium BMS3Bbin05]HDO22823.1 DNA polymerase III subunit beta [Nitrospirota bacterium]HDZ88227.1 DNA polymerase III subunit beta [Nitrospirota bacterium]
MKITVSRDKLHEKLSDIQSIVEKKTTMQILSHFLLNVTSDGAGISATDLETAIQEPLPVEKVDAEGSLCIPARKLFEIVREVDGDISLSTDDSEWLRVKADASNFRLACLDPGEFPKWPYMEDGKKLIMKASDIFHAIEKTLYSAGESDTRYTLNGILFHIMPSNKELVVVGTDGHRLSAMFNSMDLPFDDELKVIIPRKAASELRKFLSGSDSDISVFLGKNHIQFDIGEVKFLTRLIEGTYPNYDQVIPKSNEKKLTINKEAFVKALRRTSIMSREKSNAVKFDIAENLITVTASNPDLGEAKDQIVTNYSGDELSLGFNARYLLDALSAIDSDEVVFELQDSLSPTLLKGVSADNYICVVMPMRI